MALIYSATATATVSANTNSVAITGMDLSAVLPGMVINLGSREKLTGDGYIIASVTPNGSSGGTVVTVGAIPMAFTSTAFIIDTRDFNGTAPNYLIAMYTQVLVTLSRLTGSATALFSGSRFLALDKDQPGVVSRLLYAIGGRAWAWLEQRTLTYTPTGGTLTTAETWSVRALPDGTIPTDAILVDLTTGGADVQVTSATMVAATTVDLASAPTGKVLITGSASISSFGVGKNKVREVHFQDAGAVLVHNAMSLILPGAANLTMRAGDMLRTMSDAAGNWRIRSVTRADGTSLVTGSLSTGTVTPTGQAVDRAMPEIAAKAFPSQDDFKRIVILGSSSGAGQGASTYTGTPTAPNYASPSTSWAGLLTTALGSGFKVFNRAISGDTPQSAVNRFWSDVAPLRPTHVIICPGIQNQSGPNDTAIAQTYLKAVKQLIAMTRAIGAKPIFTAVWPRDGNTATSYAAALNINEQIEALGVPVLDFMSTLDDGTGKFLPGFSSDGIHVNDAGMAAYFDSIDIGLFTCDLDGPLNVNGAVGAWRCGAAVSGAVTFKGISSSPSNSWTIRARVRGQASTTGAIALLSSIVSGGANPPLRLRSTPTIDIADDAALITSNVQITDGANHDVVVTYNAVTNKAALYIDGTLIGSATPARPATANLGYVVGGRDDVTTISAQNVVFSDIGFWRSPLSAARIRNMAVTRQVPIGSLVARCRLAHPPAGAGSVVANDAHNDTAPAVGIAWSQAPVVADAPPSFRNRIINGNFQINQRGVAAGSTSYGAGIFTRDRWKAGSSGVTVSWSDAASGDGVASITAGTLVQVIKGSTYLQEGGSYVLSWGGTAQARVNGGSYASSPLVVTGLTAGSNATIEFNTGTFSTVQYEPGVAPTPFERRDDELEKCQRYYRFGFFAITVPGTATKEIGYGIPINPPMQGMPSIGIFTDYRYNSTSTNELTSNVTNYGFRIYTKADNTDIVNILGRWFATAEL